LSATCTASRLNTNDETRPLAFRDNAIRATLQISTTAIPNRFLIHTTSVTSMNAPIVHRIPCAGFFRRAAIKSVHPITLAPR